MQIPDALQQLMAGAVGGAPPGGPGGRPQEQGIPGQAPEGIQREPGNPEDVLEEEDPISLIQEMLDIARDFIDREDVPRQTKAQMEKITTILATLDASDEKAQQETGPASLVSRAEASA